VKGEQKPRRRIDPDEYARGLIADSSRGTCFICDLVEEPSGEHVVFADDLCVAFLPKYPTLLGRVLLAPIAHRTAVVGDFTEEEYVALQRRVYRLGRAVMDSFPTDRLYVLSLGSNDGVAHVHWHLAPLPPGVPFAEQQLHALDIANGYLDFDEQELKAIADRIGRAMNAPPT
jgi:diadenosine tetraphosphate (Ap4A) HIT family hydrolase